MVLVLASAVPFMLVIMTVSIGMDRLPIVSWRFNPVVSLRPSTPADISAGSQPDFATGFDGSDVPPLLAAVACAVGAVALPVGSRRPRANRHR
ncbi:hypothetical protein [Microbispora rosea]|uniref:hypothetical protein n=1 Tax=Microbispora rosea TaxID=58117 RepID=UPI00343433AF